MLLKAMLALAPGTAARDLQGRYPHKAISVLAETGVFKTGLVGEKESGTPPYSQRFSLEAQLRIAAVDSSIAQIFKVHDELLREMTDYGESTAQIDGIRRAGGYWSCSSGSRSDGSRTHANALSARRRRHFQ